MTVRIAAVSDIHANFPALEAVVEDSQRLNCDMLVVAGDFINCGPWPAETIRLLRSLGAKIIRGNHEGYVIGHITGGDFHEPPYRALFLPGNWACQQIKDEEKTWLMELPERLDLYGPDGVPVLVTHGTPRRNNEGLYPELPDEKIAEIMEKEVKPQQLVICGHTHRPMLRRWQDMTIVNCGSVGYSLDGDTRACYAVAEWGGGEWQVQHRRVEYDRANVLKAIKKNASHTEAGPIMHFIHRIVETGLSVGMSSFVNSYLQLGDFPEPPEDVAHLESAVSRYFSERSRYS